MRGVAQPVGGGAGILTSSYHLARDTEPTSGPWCVCGGPPLPSEKRRGHVCQGLALPGSVLCWVTSASPPHFGDRKDGVPGGGVTVTCCPCRPQIPSWSGRLSLQGALHVLALWGAVGTEPLRCLGLYREVSSAGHRERTQLPFGGVFTQPAGACVSGALAGAVARAGVGHAFLVLSPGRRGIFHSLWAGTERGVERRLAGGVVCVPGNLRRLPGGVYHYTSTLHNGKPALQESVCEAL